MTSQSDFAEGLWKLASTVRDAGGSVLQFDIIRGLLLLRFVERDPAQSHSNEAPPVIPKEARWSHIVASRRGLAHSLNRASRALEEANPMLGGALTTIPFERVAPGNQQHQDRILTDLIDAVSRISLGYNINHASEVYDALVNQVAEAGSKTFGGMFISKPLARLMAELLDLQDGATICDPFYRMGRTLVECAEVASRRQIKIGIHGQDPSEHMCAICKTNLFLRGMRDVGIEVGDALRFPKHDRDGKLLRYDRALTAPPIGRGNWGTDELADDPFGRFPIMPPKNNADYAYILHCLSILNDGGRAVVLTGRGVLFRQGGEAPIRRWLIQGGHVEVVISLPGGLLYGTHVQAALLVLRKGDSLKRDKVLFIEVRSASAQRSRDQAISQDQIEAIVECATRFDDVAGFSKVANLREIEQNQWNLNVDRYISLRTREADVDLDEKLARIHRLEAERDHAVAMVDALMSDLRSELDL
jgi:type I restriction enzyme M protein